MQENEYNPRQADAFVGALRQAISRGESSLSSVPALVKSVLKNGYWKYRIISETGEEAPHFKSFREFAETEPLEGLGATIDLLKKICRDDLEALDLIDQETVERPGGYRRLEASTENVIHSNIMNDIPDEKLYQGTTAQYALRRLRADAPEIHARVLAGELSPNAGMIEAGFRKKTITIPADPEKAAYVLLRHFSREEIAVLVEVIERG